MESNEKLTVKEDRQTTNLLKSRKSDGARVNNTANVNIPLKQLLAKVIMGLANERDEEEDRCETLDNCDQMNELGR